MKFEHFFVKLAIHEVCIHRFNPGKTAPCVVLIHGAIENSRIFFSTSGKGLAPWLAQQGYDVYAFDLPGKGKSTPSASSRIDYSQTQFITEDFAKLIAAIRKINQSDTLYLGAHSWGGVLIAAALARNPIDAEAMVFFGSKRRIAHQNLRRWLMVDLVWNAASTAVTKTLGYLPAKKMRMGSDNEPATFYRQMNHWVYSKNWIDPEDGFNYAEKLKTFKLPPTLFLAGTNDYTLGNPADVELLMNEMPHPEHELRILGKTYGNQKNYGHIDMLTAPEAPNDHFPLVTQWFRMFQ